MAFRALVALIPLTLLGIALLGAFGQERVWNRTLGPPIKARVLPPVYDGVMQLCSASSSNGAERDLRDAG